MGCSLRTKEIGTHDDGLKDARLSKDMGESCDISLDKKPYVEGRDVEQGKCQTGDCGGLLQCQGYGLPPNTLAEYTLNQFGGMEFFDISLVDGFNVLREFSPTSGGCTKGIKCSSEIVGQCPIELEAPGGCNNPCTVFKTDQHCCNFGSCGPTNFSNFFKEKCPDAYNFPKNDETSTFTC
ncbi:hypothetical protein REPUB_Repub08aG0185400 [Reevesia pubescens]